MSKLTVRVWAFLLIALGLGMAGYKVLYLGIPVTPEQSAEVWTVQARLAFNGQGKPAKAGFDIPDITPGFIKLDEDFISSRFGLAIDKTGDSRRADWFVRRAEGQQTLYYRVIVAR
jgi:hypothetical protein